MSAFKSEIKAQALHDAGVKVDDQKEAAERNAYASAGEATAHAKSLVLVQTAQRELQALVEAEKVDMAAAKQMQDLLRRVYEGVERNAKAAATNEVLFRGRAEGLSRASALLKEQYDAESKKAQALAQAEAEEAQQVAQDAQQPTSKGKRTRRVGERPPPPLKAQRREEGISPPEEE